VRGPKGRVCAAVPSGLKTPIVPGALRPGCLSCLGRRRQAVGRPRGRLSLLVADGARVIANTLRTELPEGFQKAEFLLEHCFLDRIVPRKELRSEIARLIDYCEG